MAAVLPAYNSLPVGTLPSALGNAPSTWPKDITLVPNLGGWQVGDIVLIRAEPSILGRTIVRAQSALSSGSPPHGDPSWSHAALYAGPGLLLETTMGYGVRYCPLSHYASGRDLCVRRLTRGGYAITPDEGTLIVRAAGTFFEQGYSYRGLLWHFLQQSRTAVSDEMFCSTLVAVSIGSALGVPLERKVVHRPLLPATLAKHPSLEEVDVTWCQII